MRDALATIFVNLLLVSLGAGIGWAIGRSSKNETESDD